MVGKYKITFTSDLLHNICSLTDPRVHLVRGWDSFIRVAAGPSLLEQGEVPLEYGRQLVQQLDQGVREVARARRLKIRTRKTESVYSPPKKMFFPPFWMMLYFSPQVKLFKNMS